MHTNQNQELSFEDEDVKLPSISNNKNYWNKSMVSEPFHNLNKRNEARLDTFSTAF